jgi:glycosyltransferase involved in cell wall biosynthesis
LTIRLKQTERWVKKLKKGHLYVMWQTLRKSFMERLMAHNNPPTVSVLMPIFNGEKYLELAIQSVLEQSYEDFEFIIMDDCSDDRSIEVAGQFTDPRLMLYREDKRLGIFGNSNRAARKARGNYIKFVYQDDILLPHCLNILIGAMIEFPEIGIASSPRMVIDNKGVAKRVVRLKDEAGVIPGGKALKLIAAYGNYIGEPTSVLLKKEHFFDVGGFDERFFYMGDIQLWSRLLVNHDLYYHPVPLCEFRYHVDQKSEEYKNDLDLLEREERWFREDYRGWALQRNMTWYEQRKVETQLGAQFLRRIWAKIKDRSIRLPNAINIAFSGLKFTLLMQSSLFLITTRILRKRKFQI